MMTDIFPGHKNSPLISIPLQKWYQHPMLILLWEEEEETETEIGTETEDD